MVRKRRLDHHREFCAVTVSPFAFYFQSESTEEQKSNDIFQHSPVVQAISI